MGKSLIITTANFATNGIYIEPTGYTWYCTDYTTNSQNGTPNTNAVTSYAYFSSNAFDEVSGHNINAIKLLIATTGNLTIARISKSDKTAAPIETKVINVTKTGVQILLFDTMSIGSDETVAIMSPSDTAIFKYSTISGTGFYASCAKGASITNITGTKSICVDIGYYDETL